MNLSIDGVKLYDLQQKINEFQQIISSEDEKDKNTKLLNLNIILASETSPKYKGNEIEVILNFGYLYVIWNPISFRKLLFFLIYNDNLTQKVISEISDPNEQLIEQKFIEPSKEREKLNPNKDNLSIQLQNDSGIIEIKFRNESKFKSWEKCLRERINEMTESNQEREEILEDKVITIDKEEINFGVECIFKSVNLIHENNFDNLFQLSVNTLKYFN